MRLLDLFCGAGGAAMGYHRAGWDVVGVDIRPQPRYPFRFIQADAMTFPLDGFDAIHASPPCQHYSQANRAMGNHENYPDLVAETRARLVASGAEYVIENVVGAPLCCPFMLCGSMFGLRCGAGWLRRHRLFECSTLLMGVPECRHPADVSIGVYGNGTNSWHRKKLGRNITVDEQRDAMGIDWMTRAELTQAIPPAYTEWIGRKLLACISQASRAAN